MTLYTTFDPLNNNNFTLSGGNLVASGTGSYIFGVKSKDVKTSGKYYVEYTINNGGVLGPTGQLTTGVGFGNFGTSMNVQSLNPTYSCLQSIMYFSSGWTYVNTFGRIASMPLWTTGDVICAALDLDNGFVWFRKNNGNWNNDSLANPATNTNGWSISSVIPGIVPLVFTDINNTGFQVTLNAGATAFGYSAPAGFGGWTENVFGTDLFIPKMTAQALVEPPNEAVRKLTANNLLLPPNVAIRKLTAYLFLFTIPPFGPIPVFPTLPIGFPVKVGIVMDTTIGTTKSLREIRVANQSYPLWDIEILFEQLRDQTQNQTPYTPFVGYTEYMQLVQLWLMLYGQANVFAFDCWWDNSRQDQPIAYGDGQTYVFSVIRTWGTGSVATVAPVGLVNTVSNVSVGGVTINPANYYIDRNAIYFVDSSGQVHPPANGQLITMTFTFYYLCRFVEDEQDFEEFAKNRWTVPSLKFQAVIWPETAYSE